jgi:L-amino acid N-acyltransferase YncA
MGEITIRPAGPDDAESLWSLFREVVEDGGAFLEDGSETREQVLAGWLTPPATTYVACDGAVVVGAYKLRPNHPGYGSHVANGSYMVARAARGRHVGRTLGEHSIATARTLGYSAMQYNAVIASNVAAIHLWRSLGFQVVGTVPFGFRHPTLGDADLLIMYRAL